VIERLQAQGYNVTAPQFRFDSLVNNVARRSTVLGRQDMLSHPDEALERILTAVGSLAGSA
jgi:hypothetical protein